MALCDELIEEGWVKDPRIIEAFRVIQRKDFVPDELKHAAEFNEALPIGSGQTISQPLVVAFMIEQLAPKEGDTILDIGAGSGWTTALLAHIVGNKGKVIALEVIPELAAFGKANVGKYNFIEKGRVEFFQKDGAKGYESKAPFHGILVSAALSAKPLLSSWKEQVREGGRIVVPIKNSIWVFTKKNKHDFQEKEYPGFSFVPFVSP